MLYFEILHLLFEFQALYCRRVFTKHGCSRHFRFSCCATGNSRWELLRNNTILTILLHNQEHAGCRENTVTLCKLFECSRNTDDPDGFTMLKKPRKCVSLPLKHNCKRVLPERIINSSSTLWSSRWFLANTIKRGT